MARYKVDKKKFDEKLLEEQLRSVELQKKYLQDEPLKRSEVDEYNKLQANGWIKNTLISLGVIFATAIAVIVFVLLGNMLFTNGRTGNVGKTNLDSSIVYYSFMDNVKLPEAPTESTVIYETYKVPYQWTSDDKGTDETSDDTVHTLLLNKTHDVYIDYRLEWRASSNEWVVGKDPVTRSIGSFTQSDQIGRDNRDYALDIKKTNLNNLMTDWFKGQEDGWAKTMIEDFFYTAWPLTVVLWMVFFLVVAGYLVVMVVGIRYVIRSVIGILRRAGYIASDFVTEVVDSVRSELPIVDEDQAEELDLVEVRKQVQKKLAQDDSLGGLPEYKFEPEDNLEEYVPKKKESKAEALKEVKEEVKPVVIAVKPVVIASPEPVDEEPKEEEKKESKAQDKITDIFNL